MSPPAMIMQLTCSYPADMDLADGMVCVTDEQGRAADSVFPLLTAGSTLGGAAQF